MKWMIKSHKLVHFNPRHKRMRFLSYTKMDSAQEDRNFAIYERSASHAMETLDNSLSIPTNNHVHSYPPNLATSTVEEMVTIPRPDGVQECIWKAYLKSCYDVAEAEQKEALKDVLLNVESDEIKLPKSILLDLLDVMPVLSHWDTMGLLTSVGSNVIDEKIIGYKEPFFMVMLCYKTPYHSSASKSKNILGYQVVMQVGYADLAVPTPDIAVPTPKFLYTDKMDYFDFCRTPKEGKELEQYKVYGALYDAIDKATIGKSVSNESGDIFSYTLIYPITTLLGRKHFWHIQLVPDEPVSTLNSLVDAWRVMHVWFDWPLLRKLISSELEQLDWSYAQSKILEEADSKSNPDALFLKHAMMYVPMKSFSLGGKSRKYKRYEDDDLLLGEIWECCSSPAVADGSCFSSCTDQSKLLCVEEDHQHAINWLDKSLVPDRSVWIGGMPEIMKIKYRHVIDQQLAVTRQLLGNKNDQERKEIAKQEKLKNELLDWVYSNSEKAQALAFYLDSSSSKLENISICCGITGVSSLQDVARILFPGSEKQVAELKQLFDFGALTVLSRLIECHPFKGMTHSQLKFKDQVRGALECFNSNPYKQAIALLGAGDHIFVEKTFVESLRDTGKFNSQSEGIVVSDVLNKIVEEFTPTNIDNYLSNKNAQFALDAMGVSIRAQPKDIKFFFSNDCFRLENCNGADAAKKIRLPVPVKVIFNNMVLGVIKGIAGVSIINVTLKKCSEPEVKDVPKLLDYGVELYWTSGNSHFNVPRTLINLNLDELGIRTTFCYGNKVAKSPHWIEANADYIEGCRIIFDWKYWRITE